MSGEKGVKELLELLAGLKEVALVVKDVAKDHKLGVDDLMQLKKLFEKRDVLMAAFEGASGAVDEVKDLSLDEVMQVVDALIQMGKDVKAA